MDKQLIIDDFVKALGQIGDRRFRGVLLRSLALTLSLLAAFGFGFTFMINLIIPESFSLPWIGEVQMMDGLVSGVSLLLYLVLSVFLMIPVASVFIGFFVEQIADAVEDVHYPELPAVQPMSLWATVSDSLRFLMFMVLVNILALIIYFASTLLAPVIFWLVNGLLLGREYFHLVALRRLGAKEAKRLRKKHLLAIWTAGTLMAIPLSIPIVNLIVPILGVATFTHQFHRLNRKG